eukprot:TRINITY_DN5019_c0_g1_i1.p1 TRINITY_DN5019_c0_g1~~TRINITY_DN5019_c0_g1_i1.p1  ORF type:complete len:444 (+),score=122.14 TRINITY_DN5019_c0_g1_i1:330-1661(+)
MLGRLLNQGRVLRHRLPSSLTAGPVAAVPFRRLNIHEYLSQNLLEEFQIPNARGSVASTPEEAEHIAHALGGNDFVVKAQVLAGGRGKGSFTNGFQGGVHTATSPEEVKDFASKMLGERLVTKQTGAEGKQVSKVYVVERMYLRRETYFAIAMDRAYQGPVLIASSQGGMDIEQVARDTPHKILKEPIDIMKGIQPGQLERLAAGMGFSKKAQPEAIETMRKLHKLFLDLDCTLVEINPMGETPEGRIKCIDAKLNFDANAEFRQKKVFSYRDKTQEDPREVAASEFDLNYIGLDGSIGCLVNGAGLAMATMDIIKLKGGNPANFLDLGGGANEGQVTKAFEILDKDPQVRAILVNIFGGIMRCDIIALGIIRAVQQLGLKKPLVVRLEGTNVDPAFKLIEDSGLRILTSEDLDDAAAKAVRVAEIMRMAEDVNVSVNFELPL